MNIERRAQRRRDRLAGLAPEQIASYLNPEQRLAGLAPEQIASYLKPDELMRVLRSLSEADQAIVRELVTGNDEEEPGR